MTRIISSLFVFLLAFAASAQVVQPSYVRQSKSALVQVFTAAQTSTGAITSFDSSVIETTSFNSVQVSLDFDPSCAGNIQVLSSLSKTGPFILNAAAPNGQTALSSFAAVPVIYNVGNLGPYVKFRFNAFGCVNGINLAATLVPFPSNVIVNGDMSAVQFPVEIGSKYYDRGTSREMIKPLTSDFIGSLDVRSKPVPVDFSTPVSVSSASATTVISAGSLTYDSTVIIQNQGTVPVRCKALLIGAMDASNYGFSLKAGSVAGDGLGGVQQILLGSGINLKCIAIGGTGSVGITLY
jgi:hypothetical protein